jgi:hypothetical protein
MNGQIIKRKVKLDKFLVELWKTDVQPLIDKAKELQEQLRLWNNKAGVASEEWFLKIKKKYPEVNSWYSSNYKHGTDEIEEVTKEDIINDVQQRIIQMIPPDLDIEKIELTRVKKPVPNFRKES